MAEDDVEVVIDAEMSGNAAQQLAAAAQQAQALADAMERARAAGAAMGGGMPGQMPGETPFGQPGVPLANASPQSMAMAAQGAAMQQQAIAANQQQNQQLAEDQESGDAGGGGHAVGWRGQLHGLRMLSGGSQLGGAIMQGGMGISGRFGTAGIVGGGSEIATGLMKEAATWIDTIGNSSITASEKMQTLVERIPVIGGLATALTALTDAISGAAEKMRQQALAFASINAAITAEASRTSKENPLLADLAGSSAGVAATTGITANYGTAPDPVADPAGYAAWKANIGVEDKRVAAERTSFEAKAKQEALIAQLPQLQERLAGGAALEAKGAAGLKGLGLEGQSWGEAIMTTRESSADIKRARDAAFALQGSGLEVQQGASAAIEANITAQKQAQLEIDKQAQALGQARLDQLNEQLKLQTDMVNKAKSQTESIAGMDPSERQNALLALQQAGSLGIQSLTSEQKGLIGSVPGGSDKLKELYRDLAVNDPNVAADVAALRQGVATSGASDQTAAGMDLAALVAQMQQTQQKVFDTQQANAEAGAAATSDSMERYTNEVIAAIERGIEVIRRKTSLQALEKQVNAK